MSIKKISLNIMLISVLLAGYFVCSLHVLSMRERLPAENMRAEAMSLSPVFLKIVGGEFKGLWADYLLLKASVFIGGYSRSIPQDWEAVYLLFKQSLALDPYFFSTCYYTQGILAGRESMHEKAIELLEISRKHRFWDWEPGFYVAFDYFYYLRDNLKAAGIMRETAKLKGAPPIVATLGARFAQESGETRTAIAILKIMYDRARDKDIKARLEKRIMAHLGILTLERAVGRFTRKYGRRPSSLNELTEKGIINKPPENPFGSSFLYDNLTGRISFD
ncbi:MAG: hypothetical protein J7L16_09825 [Deltaproteobacteria bacterium]|nr:hypothetical protein [Deltaproteobacteria bacterium]